MKTIILAGGVGSRLSEETDIRPKPMVEIGDQPILWHIMKIYAHYGFSDFVDRPRLQGRAHQALLRGLRVAGRRHDRRPRDAAPSRRTSRTASRGLDASTLVRHRAGTRRPAAACCSVAPYLDGDTFMMTFGDGVVDVDINALVAFHRAHGKLATLTAVRPPARFGACRARRRPGRRLLREAAGRRGLDQRRLLRPGAGGPRLHRRR